MEKPAYKRAERSVTRTQVVIIMVISIAIIVAVILSNQAYSATKQRATDQFNQQQLALARSAAISIEQFIINVEDDLLALSELPAVQRLEPGIQNELKAIYLGFPPETSLRRLDKGGTLRSIYQFIAYAPVHVGDHIWSVAVCAPCEEVERIIAAAHPRELLVLGYIILLLIAGGSFIILSERRKEKTLEHEVRRRTEELRESEEEYRSLVESTDDSVYLRDTDCRYLFISDKHLSRLGLPRDQVIGKSYGEFHAPEETKELAENVKRVFETGKSIQHEHLSRSDNRYIIRTLSPVKELDGGVAAVTIVSKDITALKHTEKRIKEERDNLNLIFESMVDGVYLVSDDYKVEFMNRVLIDELGDHVGDICYKAFHDREEPCPGCKNPAVMKGKTVRWEWSSRRMNKTYDLVETPLKNIDGSISKLTIFRDITERKRMEEERAGAEKRQLQLHAELEKSHRELKDFAYIVSHDLKAPLRAISALAEWIVADYRDKLDEEGKKQLDLLLNRVRRMHGLIDSVLRYSMIERVKGEKEEVDLNALVSEIIAMLNPPENIRIEVVNELPTILCERTRLEQVFQNLLSNAVRYMDKPKGEITIGCTEEEGYWKFHVADNGPGIEERYYDKIFQIFQTLKPRDDVESTGVGLTIVKKIVESQGGEIWVHSKVGEGSTFFFSVPKRE